MKKKHFKRLTYLKDSLVYLSEADTRFSDGGM